MPPPSRSRKRRRGGRATEAAAAEAEADSLISLPTDVLDEILTRLGIRDAVRTSALSRAWRRRWQALPSLDLDFRRRLEDGKGAPKGLGAVDGILLRCPGRVRLFHACLDEHYAGRVHDWLCVLSRRGVESLDLSFRGFPALPSSIFSCSRLTSLSLFCCTIPLLPPGFVAFPELRKLILVNVRLQDYGEYQLEEIIDTSPLLDYLVLTDVYFGGDYIRKWVIQAPNLRHLSICSEIYYGWILEGLTSLRSAVIDLWDFVADRKFAKLLSGVVQVRKLLVVTHNAPEGVQIPEILMSTFHNLKSLKLYMHFCEQPPIMLIFCLLKSAPNLEKLKIQIFGGKEQKFEANGEFQNALWTDGMCANLLVVQMIGIYWHPNEMSFMELILSKARLLHTLSVSHG
ncbi:unnamed protein product [Alopecurus aequalis]